VAKDRTNEHSVFFEWRLKCRPLSLLFRRLIEAPPSDSCTKGAFFFSLFLFFFPLRQRTWIGYLPLLPFPNRQLTFYLLLFLSLDS